MGPNPPPPPLFLMFRLHHVSLFAHLVRSIDPRGFRAKFTRFPEGELDDLGKKHLRRVVRLEDKNMLFCGSTNTGKLTLLKKAGEYMEKNRSLKVAYVSADALRANRLSGLLIHHFLGMRLSTDDLPSQEQLESTFHRHVRLIQSSFSGCIPSLADIDLLILDSLEKIPPSVFLAMEMTARRVRGALSTPFGGLRVIAAANWWELPVTPSSDTGGYLFQSSKWEEIFPVQSLLKYTYHQNPKLTDMVEKAQFDLLTDEDIQIMETQSLEGKSARRSSSSLKAGAAVEMRKKVMMPLISNLEAITRKSVRFPRQRAIKILPDKFRLLKQTDIGSFLVNMLIQSTAPVSFGLVDGLSLEEGDQVHLLYDSEDRESCPVEAGAVGEVVAVREHYISVRFFEVNATLDIPRMRMTCHHPHFPEVIYEIRQYPLFPREKLCPLTLRVHPHAFHVGINGLHLTDTNDLGCLLSRMRDFDDFVLTNTLAFASLDNMVHESTRIYYHQLLKRPISTAEEHWCRNCKSFVLTKTFYEHWAQCVQSTRWCQECDTTVPLELLEPHKEKHQIVLCLDCGQAIEWRYWDDHRLSCPMMMREITPLNEFLPLRTRQLALELGLDKRDLHTMKAITKSCLPKSRHLAHKYKPQSI